MEFKVLRGAYQPAIRGVGFSVENHQLHSCLGEFLCKFHSASSVEILPVEETCCGISPVYDAVPPLQIAEANWSPSQVQCLKSLLQSYSVFSNQLEDRGHVIRHLIHTGDAIRNKHFRYRPRLNSCWKQMSLKKAIAPGLCLLLWCTRKMGPFLASLAAGAFSQRDLDLHHPTEVSASSLSPLWACLPFSVTLCVWSFCPMCERCAWVFLLFGYVVSWKLLDLQVLQISSQYI